MTWSWHHTLLANIAVQAVIAAYIAVSTFYGGTLDSRKGELYAAYAEEYEKWAPGADPAQLFKSIGMTPAEMARYALAATHKTDRRDFVTFLGAMVLLAISLSQFRLVRKNAREHEPTVPPKP
jgi:hypothetical protein